MEDYYDRVDPDEFYIHCQNGARVVDEGVALGRCFVLPSEVDEEGRGTLRVLLVGGEFQVFSPFTREDRIVVPQRDMLTDMMINQHI